MEQVITMFAVVFVGSNDYIFVFFFFNCISYVDNSLIWEEFLHFPGAIVKSEELVLVFHGCVIDLQI